MVAIRIPNPAILREQKSIGETTMPKRTTDYRSALLEDLRDPAEAANYLNAALRDSEAMFLVALRDVAESHHMAKVAAKIGVSREGLYRMLCPSGNPTYQNFLGVLKAIGIEFGDVRPSSKPAGSGWGFQAYLPVRPSGRRQIAPRQRGRRALRRRTDGSAFHPTESNGLSEQYAPAAA